MTDIKVASIFNGWRKREDAPALTRARSVSLYLPLAVLAVLLVSAA
jgi:hypothetical protein